MSGPKRDQPQREKIDPESSSSEEESGSASEAPFDEPMGEDPNFDPNICPENQIETSNVETRQSLQDDQGGSGSELQQKIKTMFVQGNLHDYMKFFVSELAKKEPTPALCKLRESVLREVKKYIPEEDFLEFERELNKQNRSRSQTQNSVSKSNSVRYKSPPL